MPHKDSPVRRPGETRPVVGTPPRRPPYKKPNHPPVRIDTCIVGDDTTCDSAQNEMCRTEDGVSSCHCRPGYNRRKHRDPCRRKFIEFRHFLFCKFSLIAKYFSGVVSMVTSLRVDRLYDRKVKWQDNLGDPDSEEYRHLSYEASQAVSFFNYFINLFSRPAPGISFTCSRPDFRSNRPCR